MPTPLDLRLGERLPRGVLPTARIAPSPAYPRILLFASFLLCLICASCGAVGSGPPEPAPVSVTVTPNQASVFLGGSVQFSASVQNGSSSAVTWQVNQTAGGSPAWGTITSTGYYTAPLTVPGSAAVTVSAVMQANSAAAGSASVTIQSSLSVSPPISSLTTLQPLQLSVAGVGSGSLSWLVDGVANGSSTIGTIANGLYTPPPTAGAHQITAILNANTSVTGSSRVYVTDFAGTLTWRNDNSRSGVNSHELALAPSTVSSSTFGKLFSCQIDGNADAQPLYVPNLAIPGMGTHNVIFVATENDSVFAFDADATPCQKLWMQSLVTPTVTQPFALTTVGANNTDVVSSIGITGTPVIGGAAPTLFVVAAAQTINENPVYSQKLFALDLATGDFEIQPAGTEVATLPGQNSVFYPLLENQRAALLLDNGTVYAAFGSYEEQGDYHGWLSGFNASSLAETAIFDSTPQTTQGGIWQSGGGPSADSNHNVYVETGQGPFDVNLGGQSYSNSFLQFETSQGLSVSAYFSLFDLAALDNSTQSGGASAPLLLPDNTFPALPHLMIGGSKNGCVYLVNRDGMGNLSSVCPGSLSGGQASCPANGAILSTPLFWNNAVFLAPACGNLSSYSISASGILAPAPSASSPETLGPQGATPVISANGTNGAILWLIDSSGALATPNTSAILRAYDPNNLSNEIYNSAMAAGSRDQAGLAVKFTLPTVANGKVYVGTQTELDVYGFM